MNERSIWQIARNSKISRSKEVQARGIDGSSQNVARFERRNVWAGNMKGYQGP